MLIIFYMLLMLRVGRCTDDQIIETKSVDVGHDVKLTCPLESTGSVFWIRLVSGNFPRALGKTYGFERVEPHIATKEEPGTFVLHIMKAKLSDAAVYFCMKILRQKVIFLKGTDLRVEDFSGPEPDITAVPPSDPVRPGDSVTLQCSVFSENRTCPGDHSVFCFGDGSSFKHTRGISVEEYGKNPEGLSRKKCVYNFFKNISSSDAGTYYCAVLPTCGEILLGNRSKLNTEVSAVNMRDSQKDNTILCLLCAALAISLIVIAFLIYTIKKLKKNSCGCCNAAVALQTKTNKTAASGDQQSQQKDEDSLVYSAPTFTGKKSGRLERRDAKTEEEESIYTDVRTLGLD